MTDPRTTSDDVAALIERIVREAHIVSAGERDALRRELADHFEDAARAGDVHDVERAVARFGSAAEVADGLRRAHRPGRRMLYAAKVSVSVVAATLVALALQLPLHLERSGGAITVAPLYAVAARVSIFAVLAAIAAWELDVEWLCTRLESDPVKLAASCLALFAVLSGVHAALGMEVPALRALVGAAMLIAVWTCSVAIVARSDRAFLRVVGGEI